MEKAKTQKQNSAGGRDFFDIQFKIRGKSQKRTLDNTPDWMKRFLDIHNEMGNLEEYSVEKTGTHA